MREQWYGDNRDLVKWAKLVELARSNKVQTIVQIAMFRPNKPEWNQVTGGFPPEVIKHFRTLGNIRPLGKSTGLKILVWDIPFCSGDWADGARPLERDAYFADVVKKLQKLRSKRVIAFLDPDTGLEPKERPGPEHVTQGDLKTLYAGLKPYDWLVLYQHAPRLKEGDTWIAKNHQKFAGFLDVPPNCVETLSALQVANDVVLFAVKRTAGRAS